MPKFKKESIIKKELKKDQKTSEKFMFTSIIVSSMLSGVFLIISFLFNIEIITVFMNKGSFWDIIDILIKISSILLGFFFMMISIGNYQNLIGKSCDWKFIFLLLGLSLVQTLRNLFVFLFTLLGLGIILIYLFFVQEN